MIGWQFCADSAMKKLGIVKVKSTKAGGRGNWGQRRVHFLSKNAGDMQMSSKNSPLTWSEVD
jgi:hypothetical protein